MESCVALREGRVDELPVKLKTLKVRERHLIYIYVRCNGETAIHRRGPGDIWQGLWEPLLVEDAPMPDLGCPLTQLASGVKHVLTHRIIVADFYVAELSAPPQLPDGYIWISEKDIDRYALPRLVELLLETLH